MYDGLLNNLLHHKQRVPYLLFSSTTDLPYVIFFSFNVGRKSKIDKQLLASGSHDKVSIYRSHMSHGCSCPEPQTGTTFDCKWMTANIIITRVDSLTAA